MDANWSRKQLVSQIDELSETEHHEIYKILEKHNVNVTHNTNGAFVNFSVLDPHIVDTVKYFVDFSLANKDALDDYDRRMSDAKISNDCRSLLKDSTVSSSDETLGPLEDWNGVIRRVIKHPKEQEELARYVDILARAQALDNRMQRKTAINNKFTAARKKYTRRTASGRNDPCDLPDHLESE